MQGLAPAIAHAQTQIGGANRPILALLEIDAGVVFDMVHRAHDIGHPALVSELYQGIGSDAVLGVVNIVAG